MSTDEDSKKSGLNYVLLLGVLLLVVISFFTIPFAAIGLAIKKSGFLGPEAAAQAEKNQNSGQLDFAALRATIEKAAVAMIHTPNLQSPMKVIQIESPPSVSMEKTKQMVRDVLKENHHQFVEAVDPNQIRIIVILKSSEWPDLAAKLMEAADIDGFVYRGPSKTATAGDADTVLAEIEIRKK